MDKRAVNALAVRQMASAALKGIKGGGRAVKAYAKPIAATAGTLYGLNEMREASQAGDSPWTSVKDFAKGSAGNVASGLGFIASAPIFGPQMAAWGAMDLAFAPVSGLMGMTEGRHRRQELRDQIAALRSTPPTNPHINYAAAGAAGLTGLIGANALTSRIPWLQKRRRLRTILNAALTAGAGAAGYYGANKFQQSAFRKDLDNVKVS